MRALASFFFPGLLLSLPLVGCADSMSRDAGIDAHTPDAGGPPPPASELTLLFAMDNSSSTVEAQQAWLAELPALLAALTTGDRDGDGAPDFAPFERVRFGVITSDMGTGGHPVPSCGDPMFGDDGVLQVYGGAGDPACEGDYAPVLALRAGDEVEPFAARASCQGFVGSNGCGFEQPLEAILKGLSPSAAQAWTADGYAPPAFFAGAAGHGDGANAGLLDGDSLLAVVALTDEDDCSSSNPDLYDPLDPAWGGVDGRCRRFPDAMHSIRRYAEGLVQLRRHPSRVVYLAITGMPIDLEPASGARPDYDALVSDDLDVRDDRMEGRPDPIDPRRTEPACSADGGGLAFPGVRMIRLARALDALGGRASAASVCNGDHGHTREILLSLLRP